VRIVSLPEVPVSTSTPSSGESVRMPVLQRLAEQAMGDQAFRDVARHDLLGALRQFGYDLNDTELALVLRFRDALEEAGVDLFLKGELDPSSMGMLHDLARDVASGR
jgi:hypothetical protein